jgi:hypothetical protein
MLFEENAAVLLNALSVIVTLGIAWLVVLEKGISKRISLLLVVVAFYIIGVIGRNGISDIFFIPPMTLEFSLMVTLIVFVLLKVQMSFAPITIFVAAALYFILFPASAFAANLILFAIFLLFFIPFIFTALNTTYQQFVQK